MIVLRSTFDRLQAEAQALRAEIASYLARIAELRAERDWLRAQVALKDAEMLALRREGFDPPPAPAPVLPSTPAEELDAEIRRALETVADPGDPLWLSLVADARADLAAGASPEEIAEGIRRGSSLNPFHA